MHKVSVKTQSATRMKLLELVGTDLILFPMILSSVSELSWRVMNSCLFILDIHLPPYLHECQVLKVCNSEIKCVIICKGLELDSELPRD